MRNGWQWKKKSKNNNNRSLPSGFFFILFLLFIRSIVMMILEPESILLLLVGCCVFLVHHLEQTWEKKIIAIHIHIQNNEKLNATNLVTKIDYLYLSLSFSLWILFLFACFFLFLCLCFFIIQQHDWIQIWMKKKTLMNSTHIKDCQIK